MSLPIVLAAISGGLGFAKGLADKEREGRQRRLAGETARMSPWTGMKPNEVHEADILGTTAQGALTGASMGQNIQGMEQSQQFNELLNQRLQQDIAKNAVPAAVTSVAGAASGAKALAPQMPAAPKAPVSAPTFFGPTSAYPGDATDIDPAAGLNPWILKGRFY
jgi:hypothetical protein